MYDMCAFVCVYIYIGSAKSIQVESVIGQGVPGILDKVLFHMI